MYCRNCGNKLTDDSMFCPNCGAQTEKLEVTGQVGQQNDPDCKETVLEKDHTAKNINENASQKFNISYRQVAKILLLFVMICFTFPFVTVSCTDQKASLNGFEVATRILLDDEKSTIVETVENNVYGLLDKENKSELEIYVRRLGFLPNIYVFIAFSSAATGLYYAWSAKEYTKQKRRDLITDAITGFAGLILFRVTFIPYYGLENVLDFIDIQYEVGWLFALLLYCGVALMAYMSKTETVVTVVDTRKDVRRSIIEIVIGGSFIVIFIGLILMVVYKNPLDYDAEQSPMVNANIYDNSTELATNPDTIDTITLEELKSAYESNELLADRQYAGKYWAVQGKVEDITTMYDSTVMVTVSSIVSDTWYPVEGDFEFATYDENLYNIKTGDIITVAGCLSSDSSETWLYFKNCSLSDYSTPNLSTPDSQPNIPAQDNSTDENLDYGDSIVDVPNYGAWDSVFDDIPDDLSFFEGEYHMAHNYTLEMDLWFDYDNSGRSWKRWEGSEPLSINFSFSDAGSFVGSGIAYWWPPSGGRPEFDAYLDGTDIEFTMYYDGYNFIVNCPELDLYDASFF